MNDSFEDLARYYDRLMVHVDYDRWYAVAGAIAGLLPRPFLHVDLACGTGTLLRKLRKVGWNSFGLDLSVAMLRAGSRSAPSRQAAGDSAGPAAARRGGLPHLPLRQR
jgi:predicted TPR repeat methyltransferase